MAETTKRLSTSLAELYSQRAAEKRYGREQEEQQREYERAMAEQAAAQAAAQVAAEREQNQGGFLGGIGYSLEKVGLGFLSGIEGIWDYTAGGLAKLFGADDWAEQQIANDWVNYNHADEWFNPSEGWQFVGDVAGGIGTSVPAIAGVAAGAAIAYFSGGTLTPVAASLIAGSIAGLGAAGRATKEAYDQTGELTGKEFGYGALVGVTEGAIEGVSSAIGAGTGAVVKSISKSFGKEVAKSATRNTLLKGVVKGFAGEAFEEGVQAILEPVYKRMTYDPNAKNATFQEVAYAALVGGLSGAIMGGGDVAVRNIRGTTRGNTLVNEGKAGDVITTAEQISSYQTENQTDYETFQVVQNTLDELKTSLQKTDGEVRTVRQKMLLGVLEQANTSAAFEPIVTASAENIYNNAETVAARLNELGYQDQNGKPIQVTAEQIREGIDTTDVKKFRKTMSRALKTNSVLRTLAVADTVGQISMDTARFRDATLAGQQLSTQADLNRFVEQATDAERQAVADRLGIENWETLTNEQFHDKITEFVANGGVQEYQQERRYVKEAQAVAPEAARKHLPRMVNLRNDGTYRYTQGGTDIAITKRGDSYYVYDYESGLMSKALSRTETNRVLREIHTNEQNYQNGVRQHTEAQNRLREQAAEIDTYARENISEYKNLSAAGQAAIRATIRQGRAAGVQEDFVLSCARVSARSGLRVVFSKEASFVAANGSYADGAIDLKNNRIIINPEAKSRSGESVLIHELTHAIYNDTDGSLTVAEGLETMTDAEKEKIRKRYAAVGQGGAVQVSDEINAHFAEQTLSNRNILERLVQKKQTLKEKILGFFKKARTDYQSDEKLTGAAARLYRQYKKLFDEFSARNQRYLGVENVSAEAEVQAGNSRFALSEAFERLGKYTDSEIASIEATKHFRVARSYSDVRQFIADAQNENTQKRLFLGKVTPETAAKIFQETGINAEGKGIALSGDDVRHIFARHGVNGSALHQGDIAVTQENFENIIETLIDPDSVSRTDQNGTRGILFQKEIGGRVTAITLVSEKKKALTLKSAWITKSGGRTPSASADTLAGTSETNGRSSTKRKQATSPSSNAEALNSTSETLPRIKPVSTDSISQNAKNVNSESQKGKKFALPDTDSDGGKLNAEQREFFGKSAIVDADGKLLKMYHGTAADFTVFDLAESGASNDHTSHIGFWFTPRKAVAENFAEFNANEYRGKRARVQEVYLNIENPKIYAPADNSARMEELRTENIGLREQLAEEYAELKETVGRLNYMLYFTEDNIFGRRGENNIGYRVDEDYYVQYMKMSPEQAKKAKSLVDAIKKNNKQIKANETEYYRLQDGDSFLQMSDDLDEFMEWITGTHAHERGFGREHYAATNAREAAEKFRSKLIKEGYDGIWIKDTRVDDSGDQVVAFYPEQIKLVTNKRPTKDVDIRYALALDGETVSGTVEETNDLVALHNLSEEKLLKVLDLGGFPMPSIAVTKPSLAHDNFGDITVVFGKETIDPRRDSRNRVFSRDAWTPTTPRVEYKLNEKRAEEINSKINSLIRGSDAELFGYLALDESNMQEYLNRNGGDLAQSYRDRDAFKYAYLRDKGIDISLPTVDKVVSDYGNGTIKWVADNLGKSTLNDLAQAKFSNEAVQPYVARVNELVLDYWQSEYNTSLNGEIDLYGAKGILQEAARYADRGFPKSLDERAAREVINEHLDESGYNAWIDELFSDVVEKAGLRNNLDPFTAAGRSRSFEALHDDYTLENVVRAMSKADPKGGSWLGLNPSSLAAKLSKEFKSISDMKKAAASLTAVADDAMSNFTTTAGQMLDEITADMVTREDYSSNFSYWNALDGAREAIGEIADRKLFTEKAIADYMKREYSGFYNYNADIGNKILGLFAYAKQMTETGYFEAKPRRAVNFSEIKSVLLPETASDRLKSRLDSLHIPYSVYGSTTTERSNAIQRLDGVRFALPDTDSTGASLSQEQREFFKDSKVVDEKGHLLKVYHGTPRGEFTVFNAQNGAYFTENEAYARRYMQAHNSPTARLIEAYLNITKPFDTRQEAERRIFEREFYRKWGNGTPLSDVGLPDWTDADDLIDFINENGYDYDGLILDEGGDGGYGEAVTRRGVSYVAFSPEQIKLTTNKQPTGDADIRFALSDSVVNVDSANETAAWTSERMTDLIERYGATNPRYTQAYATWINPADFVKATTVNQARRNQIYDEAGNLDIDRLSHETQTPYLSVDYETMRIVGHEGRHRMAALAKAGVKRVAVAIRFTENSLSRYDARIMDGEHKLKGQTFSSWDADTQRVRTRTSHNSAAVGTLVPINAAYSARLSEFTSERGVRFALDSSEDGNAQTRGNYSVGQRARFAANNTGMRVYTKAEAAEVINSIIEERLVFEDIGMYGELRGKDRQAVIDYLFRKLNTVKEGYRGGVALRIADYMIEHTVLTDMYADSNGEVSEAMRKLSVLRRYMHKIDLRHIQDEIQYRFDKRNSINLVWGAKEGGIAPDTLPQLLAEEGIFLDAINEADCFLQMVDMYEDARAAVNNATEQVMLSTYGDARTIKNLRQQIARDVLNAYEQKGRKSKYAKLVEKYTKQIAELKQRLRESNANNRLINSIVDQAQKMRDLKLGTFQNATQYDTEIFRSSIEKLGKIKFRGNFNIAGTRKIMADLRTWYTKENPLLADSYEQGIADMLDEVANGKTNNYTKRELQSIRNIMAYFTNYVEHFNKVYRQGRWVDAVPEATRYIDILHRNEELKSSWFMRKVGTSYLQTFGDPMSVMRRMDRYESGFYTEIFTELRDSKIDAEIAKMQLTEEYEAFLKKNKKYLAQATKETVQYRGVEIPRMQLISLYMTLKRQHAQAGLAENGFGFWNAQDQRVRVDGFAKGITEESELRAAAVEEQARIAELLTETDKEYIAILEKGYQEAGRLKADRDIQRLGFTNATEDYYYPIRRGNIAKNVDSAEMQQELDRISNASFNKDTVRGAKQELYIESADVVFNRHVRGVVQYAYISPAIETYNKLYNLDIAGTPNKPVSVSTESANVWKQGNDYFKKLITDIQGISPVSSEGRAVLSFIRGSYAKFQLGANPKTWVTQLSSLFSASSLLDASSIARGMTVSAKDVDTYCPLAKLRAQDNTAAMAQGVLDKVGRVSNVLMAPIGKMDRFVVRRLFGACQVQVQRDGGAKIGTEANKIEAGKLLKRVILETQQNSLATERSAAMRSGNEIMRTLTMFSADSMKVIGRVIDSVGELSALRARLRTTTDAESRATLQTQIKAARRNVRKSLTALATSALFMAAIAQLFNWLYNKDKDDDETAAQQVLVDFAGNLLGGLPLVRDFYSRIAEGYSVDNYAYSALNDLLDSALDVIDTAGALISGDETKSKMSARVKNFLYAVGQLTGIPTRNIYNVFYGLTKRFSPTTAYQIDEWFYAKNYVTDLNKAIESDDTDMIAMLTSMIFGERMGNTTMSDAVRDKFVDLYSKGYSVLPRSIGDTISYGGVEITLTDEEYNRFRAIYAQSMKDIEKMVNSGAFNVLSEEMQEKAIKQVYDAYYYDALSDLVGVDERTTIGELSKWIDMSKLSVAFVGLSDIESEKNSKGETIAGSKKKNTVKYLLKQNLSDGERLLILCYRGYTIQDGDYKGYTAKRAKRILLQYILKLKGTQAEKAALAEKCGFTVRNGRIIRDF